MALTHYVMAYAIMLHQSPKAQQASTHEVTLAVDQDNDNCSDHCNKWDGGGHQRHKAETIIGHPTCQQVQHFIMLQLAGHGEAKRGTSQFRSSSHANAKGEPTGLGLSTHSYKCY